MLHYLQAVITVRQTRLEERGASAVEYGLLIALIAAIIVAAVLMFGNFISEIFRDTCNEIDTNSTGVGGTCTTP